MTLRFSPERYITALNLLLVGVLAYVLALAVIPAVAATLIAGILLTSCLANQGSITLVNKAREPIVRASVMISGQTIELKDIPPNRSASGSYEVKSDSD